MPLALLGAVLGAAAPRVAPPGDRAPLATVVGEIPGSGLDTRAGA